MNKKLDKIKDEIISLMKKEIIQLEKRNKYLNDVIDRLTESEE
jgi:hypothetical protein